jgi:hypothetical protein
MAGNRSRFMPMVIPAFTLIAASSIVFLGCPGELDDPERFVDGGFPQSCPDIPKELFVKRCAGSICHEGANAAAGLDLIAPNVESRLVNKPGRDCPGLLVDPVLPEASLLYEKLLPLPACGSPMPVGKPALNGFELECVREWIATRVPKNP